MRNIAAHWLENRVDLMEVDSTNDYLKDFTADGLPRMAVADSQLKGKGRQGRSWDSPAGQGLYVSYLLFPGWSVERREYLNRLAALALWDLLAGLGFGSGVVIKLPNDLLVNGKKIAGILVELSLIDRAVSWAVIGIGLNVCQREFRVEDPRYPPVSLHQLGVRGLAPADLVEELTLKLGLWYGLARQGNWISLDDAFGDRLLTGTLGNVTESDRP